MGNIMTTFCDRFGISEDQACKRKDQYQLSGSKNKRNQNNVFKISEVFNTYDVNFDATDSVLMFFPRKFYHNKVLSNSWMCKKWGREILKVCDGKDRRQKSRIQSIKKSYKHLQKTTKPLMSKGMVKHCR